MKLSWKSVLASVVIAGLSVVTVAQYVARQVEVSNAQTVAVMPVEGATGATGPTGPAGPAGPATVGSPTTRSVSLATAYQCTDNTKPCAFSINVTSTANFSVLGGTTNSGDVLLGSTNGVAGGTGTIIGRYSNSVTGTIAVGLNMNSVYAGQYVVMVPAGWWIAVRQTAGTISIASAFDQALG